MQLLQTSREALQHMRVDTINDCIDMNQGIDCGMCGRAAYACDCDWLENPERIAQLGAPDGGKKISSPPFIYRNR